MAKTAHIALPGGRQLAYAIRISARAKSLRLTMTARQGLTVTAPKGLSERKVAELVAGKSDWIAARLNQFEEVRHLLGETESARPQAFDLPALAETWRVEYRETKSLTVGARTDQPGRILVCGAVADDERCKAALRRWLARRAKETMTPWLETLSVETGLKFRELKIKNQRTRWGSCSAHGVISLNSKLLFLPRASLRYVLVHELCHMLEHNHTTRYWSLLRQFEPDSDTLHGAMRDAWKLIPAWAHPIQAGWEGI